jgi:hypothetical protein
MRFNAKWNNLKGQFSVAKIALFSLSQRYKFGLIKNPPA